MGSRFVFSAATVVAAAISASVHAALPVVYTNTSNLLPNTPNQVLQVFVAGSDLIQGENLNFQINSGGFGPIFTGVDIIYGTIFDGINTGQSHPNDPGFDNQGIYTVGTYSGHIAAVSTITNSTSVFATDLGLLATLTISTTGTTGTLFTLNMLNTLNGGSNFALGDLSGSTLGLSYPHPQFSIGSAVRQWNTNGGGAWDTDANWAPFAPYARGDTANFLGTLTSGTGIVTLDGPRVAGTINFNDAAGSYDIQAGAGGSLKLDNGSSSALLACLAGHHSISAPIQLAGDTNVSVAAGSTLTLAGGISQVFQLALSGAGKLILTGANSYGTTNIAAGSTLQVGNGSAGGSLGGAAVTNSGLLTFSRSDAVLHTVLISGGGSLSQAASGTTTIANYQGTGAVNVNAGTLAFGTTAGARHTPAVLLQSSALSVAAGTTLDLSNHDMLIHSGSPATIESKIGTAYFFGLWNTPGITSSTARVNSITSLGIMSGADYNVYSLTPGTFDGVPVANTDTVIKFTYVGDLNLDGLVNNDDLAIFNGAYYFGGTGNYALGDLNFDGLVNNDDLALFNGNYYFPPGTPLGSVAAGNSVAMPEPASLALIGLGAGLLLRRKNMHRGLDRRIIGCVAP